LLCGSESVIRIIGFVLFGGEEVAEGVVISTFAEVD